LAISLSGVGLQVGHRGIRGAVGKDTGPLYKRTQPPAPSRGWAGFVVNSKGLNPKQKVLTGFVKC
jgi:hypothetical protein